MSDSQLDEESLFDAAKNGRLEEVKRCIASGVDVNCRDEDQSTSLHLAARNGQKDVCVYLIKEGADLNARDINGYTVLTEACFSGSAPLVESLLSQGCDIAKADNNGFVPLHTASQEGHLEIVKLLIAKKADINQTNDEGATPLLIASQNGHFEVVKFLTDRGADVNSTRKDGATPLILASQNGHFEVVKLLIDRRADVNCKDKYGATPLHLAAQSGHKTICEFLVQQGAELNARDLKGYTPLRDASFSGHSTVVEYLISKGCNVKEATDKGFTSLHVASQNGFITVVKQLINKGADINAQNKEGATPLSLSSQNGHMEVVKLLTDREANVNSRNKKGATPLDSAAYLGLLGMCKYFYSKGADIHSRNSDGRTSFHWACVKGHLSVMGWILSLGFDVNETSNNGWTGLHEACNVGELKAVQYLIESKAKVDSKDKNSKTPMQLAEEENHTAVVEYLNSYMKTATVPDQAVTSSTEGEDINKEATLPAEQDTSPTTPHEYDQQETFDNMSSGVTNEDIDDGSLTQTGPQIDDNIIKELQEHFEQQKDHTEKMWSETDKQHLVGTCLLHVLLAGESEFGKTSIARSLMLKSPYITKEDDRTRVLDYWSLKIDDNKSATLYDLGGHSSYRVLSHLFHHNMPHNLTMIPHDITNTDYSITCHWLTDILTRSPKMKVWLLLTKSDLLEPSKIQERKAAFINFVAKYLNDKTESLKNKTGALANVSQSHVDDITKKYKSIITELKTGKILHLVSCKQEEAILNLHSSIANLLKEEKFKVLVSPSVRELYVQIGKLGLKQATKRLEESKQKERQKLTKSKNTELSKTNQSQPSQSNEALVDESKQHNDKPEPEKTDDTPESEKLDILQFTKFKDLEFVYEKILLEKGLQPKTSLNNDLKEALRTLNSHGLIIWYDETDKLQEFIFNDIGSFVNMLKSLFDHKENNLSYDNLKNINVSRDKHNLSVKRLLEQGMMEFSLLKTLISQFGFQHDDVLVDLLQHLSIAHKAQGKDFIFFPWYLRNPDNTNNIKSLVEKMKKLSGDEVSWHICIKGPLPCPFYHAFCVRVYKDLFIKMDTQKREVYKHYLLASIGHVDILIHHDEGEKVENKINIYLKSPVCEKQFKKSWTFMHECEKAFKYLTEQWWHGSGLSLTFKCPDCPLRGNSCNVSWPLQIITPEICQSSDPSSCETKDGKFPSALLYPLYPLKQEENKDDKNRIAECIQEVKTHLEITAKEALKKCQAEQDYGESVSKAVEETESQDLLSDDPVAEKCLKKRQVDQGIGEMDLKDREDKESQQQMSDDAVANKDYGDMEKSKGIKRKHEASTSREEVDEPKIKVPKDMKQKEHLPEFFSDDKLFEIAKELGKETHELAAYLGIPQSQVERIENDHPRNTLNQIKTILASWRDSSKLDMQGQSKQLQECLIKCRRQGLAEKVKKLMMKD